LSESQAAAFAIMDPLAADVSNFALLAPLSASALGVAGDPAANPDLFLLGAMGVHRPASTSSPSPVTYTASLDLTVPLAQISNPGETWLGLESLEVLGAGFTSLAFDVSLNDMTVASDTFVNAADAMAYFADRPVLLGTTTPDGAGVAHVHIDFNASVTVNGGGANIVFALANVYGGCPCSADFDGSGGTPDPGDIDGFFTAWLLGDPAADADCSGGTPDPSDIDVFFTAWLAGGC
jgi:hypothetical protein